MQLYHKYQQGVWGYSIVQLHPLGVYIYANKQNKIQSKREGESSYVWLKLERI